MDQDCYKNVDQAQPGHYFSSKPDTNHVSERNSTSETQASVYPLSIAMPKLQI